jgi:hypothetical protein
MSTEKVQIRAGVRPRKAITGPADVQNFLRSDTAQSYLNWLQEVNDQIKGKKITDADISASDVRYFSHPELRAFVDKILFSFRCHFLISAYHELMLYGPFIQFLSSLLHFDMYQQSYY